MKFEPLGPCIGVSVSEVEPDDLLDDRTAAALLNALEQYGVLVFGDLNLDDSTQVEFGRRLGEPELFPQHGVEFPEIFTVSLDPQKAASAEYLKGTFYWHIDGATDDIPNKATMLNAVAVANSGGETEFCNAYAAWEELPEGEKDEYCDMRVVHSFRGRPASRHPRSDCRRTRLVAEAADQGAAPGLEAPLRSNVARVGRHRRPCGRHGSRSRSSLHRPSRGVGDPGPLRLPATSGGSGDLVIWDNRGTMHRALPYAPDSERLMHRTTLVGDEAFA